MRSRRKIKEEEKVADLTPMLDVVFIMLIFFIVTATFIKETGVEIDRPDTKTAEAKKRVSLLVGVGSDSGIHGNPSRCQWNHYRNIGFGGRRIETGPHPHED